MFFRMVKFQYSSFHRVVSFCRLFYKLLRGWLDHCDLCWTEFNKEVEVVWCAVHFDKVPIKACSNPPIWHLAEKTLVVKKECNTMVERKGVGLKGGQDTST